MDERGRQAMLRELRRRLMWSLWCDVRHRNAQRSEGTQRLLRSIQRLKVKQVQPEEVTTTQEDEDEHP
jgi:hypothetical protein